MHGIAYSKQVNPVWIRIPKTLLIRTPDPDPRTRKWRKISTFSVNSVLFIIIPERYKNSSNC
jgi:hypothetical protein